jgi:CubicO group peptidase (beta-lactamase class C family)
MAMELLLVGLLAVATPAPVASVEARLQRVLGGLLPETAVQNRYGPPASLTDRMAHYNTPGMSIAVIHDGRIAWARGFGVRERGRSEPVTERTLFQAGSISKPIFALAVMRLVQEGRLDLDEDVNRYLTSWKVPANDAWPPRVTLRHLLGHSAGLTVHGFPGYGVEEALPSVVQVLNGEPPANTLPVRVNMVPGVQFRYSGGGTTVGQLLVSDLLGRPFPALMRELVLDPLGMADSTYEQPLPPPRAAVAATAHPWKGRPLAGRWHLYPEMAAAGLWTTATDLARAGLSVQQAFRGEGGTLLSSASAQALLAPSAASKDIGIGFFLEGEGSGARFGHGGWDEGFVAKATFLKDGGQGAVVMVNSNEGADLIDEVVRAIAREYAWPGFFPEEKTAKVSPETLQTYVGSFAAPSFSCTVTRAGDRIFLKLMTQEALELQPSAERTFRVMGVNAEVVFDTADGVVKSLTLKQGGRETKAERK